MVAYIVSDNAEPIPEINPLALPDLNVRLMTSMVTAPRPTEAAKPKTIPFIRNRIIMKIVRQR